MYVNRKISDLTINEMVEISGGESVFFKLGQSAHRIWCSVRDAWLAQEPDNVIGPSGNRYP